MWGKNYRNFFTLVERGYNLSLDEILHKYLDYSGGLDYNIGYDIPIQTQE